MLDVAANVTSSNAGTPHRYLSHLVSWCLGLACGLVSFKGIGVEKEWSANWFSIKIVHEVSEDPSADAPWMRFGSSSGAWGSCKRDKVRSCLAPLPHTPPLVLECRLWTSFSLKGIGVGKQLATNIVSSLSLSLNIVLFDRFRLFRGWIVHFFARESSDTKIFF